MKEPIYEFGNSMPVACIDLGPQIESKVEAGVSDEYFERYRQAILEEM